MYEPEQHPEILATEWPNGVVDATRWRPRRGQADGPDGTIETVPADTPLTLPDWPNQEA